MQLINEEKIAQLRAQRYIGCGNFLGGVGAGFVLELNRLTKTAVETKMARLLVIAEVEVWPIICGSEDELRDKDGDGDRGDR